MPQDTSYYQRRQAERMRDPEYAAAYEQAALEIAQVDSIIRQLDERRVELGMSKAQLARHIGKESSSIRRLFSAHSNPELKTVAALATALGSEIVLKPRTQNRRSVRRAGSAAA
ncbi:MAG: helix-turn-helix domain-containing protein [Gaiellaceae bacterium]